MGRPALGYAVCSPHSPSDRGRGKQPRGWTPPPSPGRRTWNRSFARREFSNLVTQSTPDHPLCKTSGRLPSTTCQFQTVPSKHLVQTTPVASCLPSPSTNTPCGRHLDKSRPPTFTNCPSNVDGMEGSHVVPTGIPKTNSRTFASTSASSSMRTQKMTSALLACLQS